MECIRSTRFGHTYMNMEALRRTIGARPLAKVFSRHYTNPYIFVNKVSHRP